MYKHIAEPAGICFRRSAFPQLKAAQNCQWEATIQLPWERKSQSLHTSEIIRVKQCLQAAVVSLLGHSSHGWGLRLALQPREILQFPLQQHEPRWAAPLGTRIGGFITTEGVWSIFQCQPILYMLQRCKYYREGSTHSCNKHSRKGCRESNQSLHISVHRICCLSGKSLHVSQTLNWLNAGSTRMQYGAVIPVLQVQANTM